MPRSASNWPRLRGKRREAFQISWSGKAANKMSNVSKYRPVLILGSSPRISLPVARSLARRGIPVDIASFQPEEPDLHSRAIRTFHRLPPREQDIAGFRAALLDLVRDKQFDLILAAGDPALAVLAELYEELRPVLHVGCPPPRAVERVLNKSLTLEIAQRCGIRVPFTCAISTEAELDSITPQLRFPVVVKPEKKGASPAVRVFYCSSLADLRSALRSRNWGSVLVQEYCPGAGVGVEILMHNGACVAKFQHRRLKEAPAAGGVAVVAVSEDSDPQLLQSSMALLRALEWEGLAMVEFRVDHATGSSALMEVNGRFWGSVSLPILAGVDFPFYYWQLLHGEQPAVPARYAAGMRWRWSPGCLDRIQNILSRGAGGIGPRPSKSRELLSAAADFSPFTREALWSWSDPLPFFAEMGATLGSFIATVFKFLWRRLLPRRMTSQAATRSRLTPEARSAYDRLRLRGAVPSDSRNGSLPDNARSVLFVCYGNLMRSPMAEAMLKHALAERGVNGIVVRSAGVHAVPGREAHPWALTVSRELSLPLDQHRAQPLTQELVSSSDAIFAMDFENLAELETLYPNARDRIFLLSRYADGKQRDREIADPYFAGIEGTRRCYSVLGNCIDNLACKIAVSRQEQSRRP
jgi:protein-tyrosine-phosphatase/predicted ATP-grasp superfamily ATP-dependent carboligase